MECDEIVIAVIVVILLLVVFGFFTGCLNDTCINGGFSGGYYLGLIVGILILLAATFLLCSVTENEDYTFAISGMILVTFLIVGIAILASITVLGYYSCSD